MSYSFYVNGDEPKILCLLKNVENYVGQVCCEEKDCLEKLDENSEYPQKILHFYIDNRSTRGIEVSWEKDKKRLQVRILLCAANEDYNLAFAFVTEAAKIMGSEIISEEGTSSTPKTFAQNYNLQWAKKMENGYLSFVERQVKEKGEILTLPCIHRNFYLGSNTIMYFSEEKSFRRQLLDKIRQCIYFKDRNVFVATELILRNKAKNESLCVWAPGIKYLFPHCDNFGIISESGAPNTIPRDLIFSLVPQKIEFLDEHHIIVDSLNDKEYTSMCQQAHNMLIA